MSNIKLEELRFLAPATEAERTEISKVLNAQNPTFVAEEGCLAILAFGGTIQSAYVPSEENIKPVIMNTVFERTLELIERFGIASSKLSGATLIAKDSRDITNPDLAFLIHAIQQIPNDRIVVTCGTYMLPLIARVLHLHFGEGKSKKIVGVTGSWLPPSQEAQDVDYNAGGTIAAMNAFKQARQQGMVFVQFHGEIFIGDALVKLDIHLPGISPRFARPTVETR